MEESSTNFPKLNNYFISNPNAQKQDNIENKKKRQRDVVQLLIRENKRINDKRGKSEMKARERQVISHIPLKVYPDEIIFKDIRTSQTYEINVSVRNLTKYVKRVRIFQPMTTKFRCDYDSIGPLAPGMCIELTISFSTQTIGDFHDSIKIISDDDFTFNIPLHAYAPAANIVFEPFINMGFVNIGKEKKEAIKFKNEGNVEGKVELKYSNLPDLTIEPNFPFVLKPGQVQEVI